MEEFFDKVKETADKAKDGASKITKHLIDKTSNVVSQTKLSFAVSETESRIKSIYEDLGKTVYERYKSNENICECMLERCKQIDDYNEAMSELKEKIAELKDSVKCDCGEFNKKNAEFCSKCGKNLKVTAHHSDEIIIEAAENAVDKAEKIIEDVKEKVISVKPKKPQTNKSEEE